MSSPRKNPKFRVLSLYNLGMCFKAKKQYDMAKAQFQAAGESLSQMDDTKKDVLYELGAVAELLGVEARKACLEHGALELGGGHLGSRRGARRDDPEAQGSHRHQGPGSGRLRHLAVGDEHLPSAAFPCEDRTMPGTTTSALSVPLTGDDPAKPPLPAR